VAAIRAFGLDVDNARKNGHSAPFAWQAWLPALRLAAPGRLRPEPVAVGVLAVALVAWVARSIACAAWTRARAPTSARSAGSSASGRR